MKDDELRKHLISMLRDIEYSLQENKPVIAYNKVGYLIKELEN